jgi:hypothetical protein
VWQGFETRENYRLSVRPKLEVRLVWAHEPEGSTRLPGLYVGNVGIGPAIVTTVSISVDGLPVVVNPERGLAGSLLDRLTMPEGPGGMEMNDLTVIGAGGEAPFLRIAMPGYSEEERIALAQQFQRISMVIEYQSMYSEPFVESAGRE